MSKRPRSLRKRPHVPTFEALAEADGADVDQLLREVSQFRLALDTDLTIAAAAADAAAELVAPVELSGELTNQAVDAGRSALEELVTRRRLDVAAIHPRLASAAVAATAIEPAEPRVASGRARRSGSRRGATGPAAGRPTGRRLRGVPLIGVGPLVGVAIVLGVGTGFFASHLHAAQTQGPGLTNAADDSLHSLSSALGDGNEQAAREAGNQLSAAIGSLIAAAPGNPAAAAAAASALTAEQSIVANTSGALGEQLRASMAAQVVALQSTVHTSIPTLLAPSARATTPSLSIPLPVVSHLLTTLPSILALPSLPAKPTPSHRPLASHSPDPDPDPSLIAILIPSTGPSAANPAASQPSTATPAPVTSSAPAAGSVTPSPSGSSSGSPSPSASQAPFPLSTSATGGVNYFPH